MFSHGCYLEEIDKFDYGYFKLSHSEARSMDPSQRIFMETAISAIEDAGYSPKSFYGTKTGIYVGHSNDSGYRQFLKDVDQQLYSISVPGNLRSMIPRRISYILNLKGPSVVFDTACSSSLVAVHYACQALRSGECDMAVAGSVKFYLVPQKEEDKFNVESVDGFTRSFDNNATGFGTGEGAVILILKPLSQAIKHNDNIYSIIRGSAINQDGASIGVTAPSPGAQGDVIVRAWSDADVNPQLISYVEAHGTGTNIGDPIEIDGLQKAFAGYTNKKQFCAIGSVKTNVGHLDHAAGIAGLVKVILSLKAKKLPPSLHFGKPNNKILFPSSPLYVNDMLRYWESVEEKRICGVSSFGFSGTNCHMIVEEPPLKKMENKRRNEYDIFCLSAKTVGSINSLITKYKQYFCGITDGNLEDICYTACIGREHYNYRLAIIAKDFGDLREKLLRTGELGEQGFKAEDIFYSGKIAAASGKYKDINQKYDNLTTIEKRHLELIREICNAYIDGEHIQWNSLYNDNHLKVSLPTYAFEKKRCWPEYQGKIRQGIRLETVGINEETAEGNNSMGKAVTAEERIIQVWKSVLGIEKLSYEATFEELGGNSLLAIKMEVELKKRGIEVGPKDILNNCSLDSLIGVHKDVLKNNEESTITGECCYDNGNVISIKGIEPFNDFFYKNCFYNSAFAIAKYYNKSINPFLLNDLVVYRNDETDSGGMKLHASYLELMPIEELLKSEAYSIQSVMKSADIVDEIKKGIDVSCPVILWIDSYFEPQRADTYGKVHRDHTLLVYGYDDTHEMFHIIDHEHMDNLNYTKCKIGYEDMINCYNGFLENYWLIEKKPTVYKIFNNIEREKDVNISNTKYRDIFLNNVSSKKNELLENIIYLQDFRNHFDEMFLNKAKLDIHIESSISRLNNIINIKQVQLYVVKELFDQSHEAIDILEKIIADWDEIRGVTVRYYYSQRYREEVFQKLIESVDNIIQLEDRLNNLFLDEKKDLD